MGRAKAGKRRSPARDDARLDLRLGAQDRVAGGGEERPARRASGARDEAESRPRKAKAESSAKGKGRRKSSGGGSGGFGLKRILYWGAVVAVWVVIAAIGLVAWVGAHLPPIQSLEIPKRPPSIQIVGLDGRVLANRGEMGGAAVALKDLPPYLPKAFIAIEDRRFATHHGVDPFGIVRALGANVLHRGVSQGGSTITQQLAKNLFLTPERTFQRKLQEAVLALWLEQHYSKAQILEMYLNRVYFGSGAYGVEAAALRYFGKPAKDVTLAEAALLAGLVKSPTRLAPTRNFDGAEERAGVVLAAMRDAQFITPEMAKTALAHPPRIVQGGGGSANYVADWVMDLLDDLIGHVEQDVIVETTIDPALQAAAERALVDELVQKGEKFGVQQGALVAMTPEGAIRALVGGRDYGTSQFNRAVAAKRQPGSSFKAFVYLTALEHGLTPDTVREDRPIDVKGWRPENYGHRYYGPVTLTQAIANSLNTVAVRLTLEVGPAAVVKTAYRLGITSKLDPNASIALGTSAVSVLEMVSAYAPFANGGFGIAPHVVARVRTTSGKVLYADSGDNLGRVVEPRYVGMMNAMMQQTLLNGTAHAADLPGWPAAGKTGTSQDFRDAWFIGYTAHLVTGVWLGNDDNSPTRKSTGGGLPVEIWSHFMKVAHQGVAVAPLPDIGSWNTGVPVAAAAPAPIQAANLPASSTGGGSSAPAPTPPGLIAVAAPRGAPIRPEPAGGGLDGWLIDRLFGRR